MQSCPSPARDLLPAHSGVATSLAVVPMYLRGRPFGALYFAPSTPVEFTNIKDAMLVRDLRSEIDRSCTIWGPDRA